MVMFVRPLTMMSHSPGVYSILLLTLPVTELVSTYLQESPALTGMYEIQTVNIAMKLGAPHTTTIFLTRVVIEFPVIVDKLPIVEWIIVWTSNVTAPRPVEFPVWGDFVVTTVCSASDHETDNVKYSELRQKPFVPEQVFGND